MFIQAWEISNSDSQESHTYLCELGARNLVLTLKSQMLHYMIKNK